MFAELSDSLLIKFIVCLQIVVIALLVVPYYPKLKAAFAGKTAQNDIK